MEKFTESLIKLHTSQGALNLPSAIFGTASTLSRHIDTRQSLRIGMWPCKSAASPTEAMGLFTVLSYLLERWDDVVVYRLFAQLDGEPADFEWSIEQSQFDVEDWELDTLDENVALWGTLENASGKWTLTLGFESDFDEEDEETHQLTYTSESLAGMINLLPTAAKDIVARYEIEDDAPIATYADTAATDEQLQTLLSELFDWQIKLMLSLWGVAWKEQDVWDALERLVEAGHVIGDDFAGWIVTSAAGHAMSPGYGEVADSVAAIAASVSENFNETSFPAINIANGLFNKGFAQQAYELLEKEVEQRAENAHSWLALGALYFSGGQPLKAIDAYQRAIEQEAVNEMLYFYYARTLIATSVAGIEIEEFILIDPDDYATRLSSWEAIEALDEALKLEPDQPLFLSQQITTMIGVQEEKRLWTRFESLVSHDKDGERVHSIVEYMYELENADPAADILKRQIKKEPERVNLRLNLGAVYIMLDEPVLAEETLDAAQALTADADELAEIDRMMLSVDDPDFEARFGEISAIAHAGKALSTDDVDFLEDVLEDAPSLAEVYVLLAKAYAAMDEDQDALEILLDGHKKAPKDPDIIELLAQYLWDSDEEGLAFEYLNKGLEANPTYVPLLALTGQYLFENDQIDEAKSYMARAEALSPRDPALAKAREAIALLMNK
jgi:tetratricopeptide (TPR) repeat protein